MRPRERKRGKDVVVEQRKVGRLGRWDGGKGRDEMRSDENRDETNGKGDKREDI